MSWRVVTVTNRCKLELRLDYLVCRGEETVKIHLSEISVLIVESTAVAVTASLLCELIRRKIKVIFCDEKHNPCSELLPTSLRYDASGCLRKQICWEDCNKVAVWTEIVRNKIYQQMLVLRSLGRYEQADMLSEYIAQLCQGDVSNREGHAAKVYFNTLWGKDFSRENFCNTNAALDYGYSILLSAFNRELAALGYLPNFGINHKSVFNHFNLSCDLMEPFRPIVDRIVLKMDLTVFSKEQKHVLQQAVNEEIIFEGKRYALNTAIGLYIKRVIYAIETGDINVLEFYTYEV